MTDVKLIAFVCHWCAYGGADQAGGLKLSYPSGVRLVRVMCSGRVDPATVLKAFRQGADGVLILGCHPGDCHYKEGNLIARNRASLLGAMLAQFGVDERRFRLDWVSAGEGERFRSIVTRMYEEVAGLGPLALHDKMAAGGRG